MMMTKVWPAIQKTKRFLSRLRSAVGRRLAKRGLGRRCAVALTGLAALAPCQAARAQEMEDESVVIPQKALKVNDVVSKMEALEGTIEGYREMARKHLKELERARASFRAHPTEANEVRLADANSKALTGLAQALDSFVAAAEPAQTALSTARASLLEGTARFKEESAGMVEEANRQQAITDEAHGRLYALAQRLAELGQLGTDGPLQSPDLARSVRNLRRIEITAQKLARAGQTEASNAEQDRRDVLNSVAYIEHAEGEELEKRFHAAIKIASADGAITNAPMSWRFRKYGYPRDDQDCREWLHKNDSEVLWLAREYVSAYRSWEFRMRRAMLEAGFDEGTAKHRYRELTDVFLNYSDHDVFEHYDGDVLKSWLQKYVEPMSKIADDVDTTPVVRVGCETVVKPGGGIEFNVNEEDMAKLFET